VPGEERRKTKILLADSQHMVREGIRQLLECEADFEVVGEAANGYETLKLARELRPDVVLMEACMPKVDSVEVIRRVKAEHLAASTIILTSFDDEEYVVSLIGAGADGYLLKSAPGDELIQSIRLIRAGEFVSHPLVAQKLYVRATRRVTAVNSIEHLTHRELEVLKLAAKGMSNKDIGDKLGVGIRTVKGHFESIFSKIGARSRTEAVLTALKHDWVSLRGE